MAKKRKSRTTAATKPAGPSVEDPNYGKKAKGVAAVGFLRSQGTRSFRKGRSGGS